MQQQPDIDKLLRERLQGAEVAPPAFVWPNVERALRRQRRRFVFFWLFGSALVFAGAGAYWLLNRPDGPAMARETRNSHEAPVLQADKGPAAALESGQFASGQPATAVSPSAAPTESARPAAAKETALAAPATRSGRATRAPQFEKNNASSPLPVVAVLPPAEAPAADLPATATAISAPARPEASPLLEGPRLSLLPLPSNEIRTAEFKLDLKPSKKRRARRNCYDFEKKSSVWLLDAYAGPSVARKTLRADYDNQPYLNRRLDTERRDWAYNAGLRASWLFDKHFLLRTGLHYDQFTEVFEYINPDDVRYLVEYTTEIVNGQPVTKADTLDIDFGESYVKTFNRFGLLDIPLVAGVEWRQGNGGISLNAGLSFNVLFWKEGKIMAPGADLPASFTPGDNGLDVFRTRVGLSASGSAQFFYHLQPRLRVFAEPYYRHVLKPVNQPNHPVEQRYGIGGVRLGMTMIID